MGKQSTPQELLPLTQPVFHILLALAAEERHGYGIMQDVAQQTDGALQLGPGTLYGCLKRMVAAGLVEETDEPIAYLHGGHSGIFPKVEAALNAKKVGDTVSVTLEPDDAFGDYDTELMRIEALDQLPPDVTVGGHLIAEQDGNEVMWRITGIADGKAVLDGNHELAGQRLRFDCKVLDIRPATQDEMTHGHVHGAHGHHH